jgi:hypothetical protein
VKQIKVDNVFEVFSIVQTYLIRARCEIASFSRMRLITSVNSDPICFEDLSNSRYRSDLENRDSERMRKVSETVA